MFLVVLYHLVALILVGLTFHVVKANYDRLPDKIPIHFGITGKADRWVKKSYFSAYLLFYVNLITWGMYVTFTLILPEKPACHWAMFSTGTSFLLYYLQVGIIKYTLGEIKNILQYMLIGSGVFFLALFLSQFKG